MPTLPARIKNRRKTAAAWASANPVLLAGEIGLEIETGLPDKMKTGDGVTAWNSLPYLYATLESNTFTGAQNEAHGANVASASTVNLNTVTGNFIDITGAATIAAIVLGDGYERTVRFNGVLTLTHSANLVLLGNANITTAIGDLAVFRGDAGGKVRLADYSRANGKALVETDNTGLIGAHGANIVAASAINLTAATGGYVYVTGTTTISTITLADGKERTVRFVNALTLTHNPAAINLPTQADISVQAGDIATFRGDSSGVVRVESYMRADGTALAGAGGSVNKLWVHGGSIASAPTVNLDAATGDYVYVTGTAAISAITLADGVERTVRFAQALTLTHNPAAINLPGNANIATAAGDLAVFRGDSGGKVRTVSYTKANGKALFESASLPNAEVTDNKVVSVSGASTDIEYPSAKLLHDQLALKLDVTGLTKAAIGLGNADNTSDTNKPVSTAQQTALDLKLNSADHLAFKAIAVSGQSDVVADSGTDTLTLVAGTNITLTSDAATDSITIAASGDTLITEGALINSATAKSTPIDADMLGLMDSEASNVLKKLSWANIKAALKTYFDTLYPTLGANTFTGGQVLSDNSLSRANFIDCAVVVYEKGTVSSTGTVTFDHTQGSVQAFTCGGAFTLTWAFSNWPPTGNRGFFSINVTNMGLGTLAFSSTINWKLKNDTFTASFATYLTDRGGETALKASGSDEFVFWSDNAGTTIYGCLI